MPKQILSMFINPFANFGFKKTFDKESDKDHFTTLPNKLLVTQNEQTKNPIHKKNVFFSLFDLDRNAVFSFYCKNKKFTVKLQKE